MNKKYAGLLMILALKATTAIAENRSELKFAALPDAVQATVSHFLDPDTITQIEKMTDTGYVKFEIISTKVDNNKSYVTVDLIVAADGEVIKLARQAPYFAIPFPVMRQLNQRYPNLKVDEVESVQVRYFHVTGKNNQQPVDLKVFDDGEIQELPVQQTPQAAPQQ